MTFGKYGNNFDRGSLAKLKGPMACSASTVVTEVRIDNLLEDLGCRLLHLSLTFPAVIFGLERRIIVGIVCPITNA